MDTVEKKRKLIDLFESGNHSIRGIARILKIDPGAARTWLAIYKYHGLEKLLHPSCLPQDESFKIKVVKHVIETVDSMTEVAGKFNIHSRASIWKWMKKYMSESDWSLYYMKRERRDQMKKEETENISENEKLKREIELLKAENAYLKKLKALIQGKENKRK